MNKPNLKFLNQHVDSVLYSYGTDVVGIELEYATTTSREYMDSSLFCSFFQNYEEMTMQSCIDEFNYSVRNVQPRKKISTVVLTEDNSERFCNIWGFEIHSDSSISPSRNYRNTVEICSKPTPLSSAPKFLLLMNEKMKNIATTNNSCGTHFHFNSSRLSINDLIKIQIGISVFEPLFYMLTENDRISKKYCKPVGYLYCIDDLIDALKIGRTQYERMIVSKPINTSAEVSNMNKYGINLSENPYEKLNSRYMGLNIYSHFYRGSIEFRYFENKSVDHNIVYFQLCKSVLAYLLSSKLKDIIELANNLYSHLISGKNYLDFILNIKNFNLEDKSLLFIVEEYNKNIELKSQILSLCYKYFFKFMDAKKIRLKNLEYYSKISKDKKTNEFINFLLKNEKLNSFNAARFLVYGFRLSDSYSNEIGMDFTDLNFGRRDMIFCNYYPYKDSYSCNFTAERMFIISDSYLRNDILIQNNAFFDDEEMIEYAKYFNAEKSVKARKITKNKLISNSPILRTIRNNTE